TIGPGTGIGRYRYARPAQALATGCQHRAASPQYRAPRSGRSDRMTLPGYEIPGVLWRRDPIAGALPLVFDSPHSGSLYPEDFAYRCPLTVLRRAEDSYVDELFAAAPEHGATLIGAVFPRSYLDVNRAADDLDPALLYGALPPHLKPRPTTRVGLVRRF